MEMYCLIPERWGAGASVQACVAGRCTHRHEQRVVLHLPLAVSPAAFDAGLRHDPPACPPQHTAGTRTGIVITITNTTVTITIINTTNTSEAKPGATTMSIVTMTSNTSTHQAGSRPATHLPTRQGADAGGHRQAALDA